MPGIECAADGRTAHMPEGITGEAVAPPRSSLGDQLHATRRDSFILFFTDGRFACQQGSRACAACLWAGRSGCFVAPSPRPTCHCRLFANPDLPSQRRRSARMAYRYAFLDAEMAGCPSASPALRELAVAASLISGLAALMYRNCLPERGALRTFRADSR